MPKWVCLDSKESYLQAIEQEEHRELARMYAWLLLQGRRAEASKLILDSVQAGTTIEDVYLQVFQPVLYEIGRLWEMNQVSVAVEHYTTAATQLIMSQLFPYILHAERKGLRMVACSADNELHEVGVRMVADFFEMSGWDTYFLGANTPMEAVLSTLQERRPHLLAISVTLNRHLGYVRKLIDRVRPDPENRELKILLGGVPFILDPQLWKGFAVDGCAQDAREAVALAEKLIKEEKHD